MTMAGRPIAVLKSGLVSDRLNLAELSALPEWLDGLFGGILYSPFLCTADGEGVKKWRSASPPCARFNIARLQILGLVRYKCGAGALTSLLF